MELPFDYIALSMFNMLKVRNMNLEITRITLIKYLRKLIKELEFNTKEFLSSFDFEEELDFFIQKYSSYIEYDGNKITFDGDIDWYELESLINEESKNYSSSYIDYITDIIESNLDLFSILGIKIRTNIYEYLLNNERYIEKEYKELASGDGKINNIKRCHLFNRITFFNMSNLLDIEEYEDLYLYSIEMANLCKEYINIPLLIDNELNDDILDNSFKRAIFLVENNYPFILRDKIYINLSRGTYAFDDTLKSELKFYLTYLELLDREIDNVKNNELKKELTIVKYRLMNALDSIYDINTFFNKESIEIKKENYNFIKKNIYYFIDELFKYDDSKYLDENGNDIVIYFYNIIKKIYIDTYYNLTNDDKIIDMINRNKDLNNIDITSNILSDVGKKKIKSLNE